MLRQSAACWLPCKVIIVKINHWFGFYSWLVVDMARWFVSQQVPSASSKPYSSNMQRMFNKDLAWFMQSLWCTPKSSKQKKGSAGRVHIVLQQIFNLLENFHSSSQTPSAKLRFPCAPFFEKVILLFENVFFPWVPNQQFTVVSPKSHFARVLFANFWSRFAYVLGQFRNCFLLISGWKNEV